MLSPKPIRTAFIVALCCAAVTVGLSVDLLGQPAPGRLPTIARRAVTTLNGTRAASGLHAAGRAVVSRANLIRIGGVLSQTSRLLASDGNSTSVTLELSADGTYTDHILVRTSPNSPPLPYRIDYDDLVPMVLFVAGGGTALYTLWDADSDRLPAGFRPDAGFLSHRLTGLMALEFHGTPYADAVYFLDTCQACLEPADDALNSIVLDLNRTTPSETSNSITPDLLDDTYINTDLSLPYAIHRTATTISVSGVIARLEPAVVDGRLTIGTAERIARPENLFTAVNQSITSFADDVDRQMRDAIREADDLDEIASALAALESLQLFAALSQRMFRQEALLDEEARDAYFLFETLALLRTARDSSPTAWSAFIDALAAPRHADANPEPWRRFLQSFCSVYPQDADCRNSVFLRN